MRDNGQQVYPPSEDTYLLLEAAQCEVRLTDRVLEVGTGSGLVAASLVSRATSVVTTDISPHAASAARAYGIDVVRTDLFAGLSGPFDLVVFNPPYLPTRPDERVDDWLEHALDGGLNGRAVIGRFAGDVGRVLAPEGRVLLLVSSLTGIQDVSDIFIHRGYSVRTVKTQNIEGETLYVIKIT